MSKLAKKIASIATTLTVIVMMVGPMAPAQAMTADELQASITALQTQLAALTAQLNTTTGTTGTTGTVPTGCSFSRNLKQGMSGADVKCLQQSLNTDSATQVAVSGAGSPGSETLYFGSLTKAAVIKYQEKYASEILASWGLTAGTGFVGKTTLVKLNAMASAGTTAGTTAGTGTTTTGTTTTGTTATGTVTTGVAGAMNVALASDNPAAATIVADNTGAADSAQSMIQALKVTFTNAGSAEAKVTQVKLTRSGISADSDISQAYLYDGDTLLAEYSSFSVTVLTFSNSAGIVTIPAGGSKTVTLKFDLTNNTASGKQVRFGINAATDIVSTAASVAGSFPITGNYMSTAIASDVGQLAIVTASTSVSVDPTTGVEVFKFTLAGSDQNLEVRKIKITNTGSTAYTDLTNFMLYDSATQIGSTIVSAGTDKTVTFDLSAAPLSITKGVTKTMTVKADIIAGTSRNYKFSFQNMTDIVVYDTQYNIFVKPNKVDSWIIREGSQATIQTGKLTVSRASDSPSGNVSSNATNVTLAKFTLNATGEDIKITDLTVKVYGSIADTGLYQAKVYYDGAQKGNTTTTMNSGLTALATGGTTFTFGNTFIVPVGTSKTIEVKADIKTSAGVAQTAPRNFAVQISAMTATGKTSMAAVTVGSAAGYQLTVSSGILSAAKSQSVPNWAAANPTGVAGATEILIASYIVTAGTGEGCDLTGIALYWASTSLPADTNGDVQNIKLYKGTKATGLQIGTTQGSVTASSSYTFYPNPYISMSAGEQFTLNVYADILTGADTGLVGQISLSTISGTGKVTNTAVNSATGDVTGQTVYISTGGALTIVVDSGTPLSGLVVMGSTGVELAKFRYDASSSPEDILVTQIIASTTLDISGAPTSTLSNITLSGTGLSATVGSLDVNGLATFDLSGNPWVIPAGTDDKVLTIKADINYYPYASSGSYIQVGMATTTYKGSMVGTITRIGGTTIGRLAGNPQYIYKTKPTVSIVSQVGITLTNSTIELLKFKVSADAKGAVNLYSVNLDTSILDIATSTSLYLSQIGLYEVGGSGSALNDYVAVATDTAQYNAYSGTSTVANSKFGGGTQDPVSKTGDIMLFNNAGTALKQISANGTVEFMVKGTVTGAAAVGDSVTVKLENFNTADPNAIRWGDALRVQIPSTYVKTLPSDSWSYSIK